MGSAGREQRVDDPDPTPEVVAGSCTEDHFWRHGYLAVLECRLQRGICQVVDCGLEPLGEAHEISNSFPVFSPELLAQRRREFEGSNVLLRYPREVASKHC